VEEKNLLQELTVHEHAVREVGVHANVVDVYGISAAGVIVVIVARTIPVS
jgi:hypothetical protein